MQESENGPNTLKGQLKKWTCISKYVHFRYDIVGFSQPRSDKNNWDWVMG